MGYKKVAKWSAIAGLTVGIIFSIVGYIVGGINEKYPFQQLAATLGEIIGLTLGFVFWGVVIYAIYRGIKKVIKNV